jgi:hypothetical protein
MPPVINTWICLQTGAENKGAKIDKKVIAESGNVGMGL